MRSYFATYVEEYHLFFYVLAVLALILGVVAFIQPTEVELPDNISYQHTGFYAYSASAPSEVYQGGKLESGAAIFPAVSCQVDTHYYYLFNSSEAASLQGTYQWTAEVSSSNGWKQNILSLPETSFEGTSLSTSVTLDVCAMEQVIQQVESITGMHNYQYFLSLSPNIRVTGEVAGMPLEDAISAPLVFVVEPQQIFLQVDNTESDPLQQIQSGEIVRWSKSVNTLSIFSLSVPVSVARRIALGGLLLSTIALALLELILRGAESDEALMARTKFGQRLVEISNLSIDASSQFVQVCNLDDLAALADRLSEKVLLQAGPGQANYYVLSGRTTYLYQKPITAPVPDAAPEYILEDQIRQGIKENQFMIYYQPAVSLETGKITHVEALVRWWQPCRGLLDMEEFSPQVEQCGLRSLVDFWALNHICQQITLWHKNGLPSQPVGINLSGQFLGASDAAHTILRTLQESGIDPGLIDLSIHEKELQSNPFGIISNLRTLGAVGMGITMDISPKKNYKIAYEAVGARRLKLGNMVLRKLDPLQPKDGFIEHCVLWAHTHQIQVKAVGVETMQQLKYLQQIGCDQAQGDLVSPPLIAQDLQPYLEHHSNPLHLMDI
jgi:EAL domain-containing protein (putative c-di-GMP-specific phosphodiesterase class I)